MVNTLTHHHKSFHCSDSVYTLLDSDKCRILGCLYRFPGNCWHCYHCTHSHLHSKNITIYYLNTNGLRSTISACWVLFLLPYANTVIHVYIATMVTMSPSANIMTLSQRHWDGTVTFLLAGDHSPHVAIIKWLFSIPSQENPFLLRVYPLLQMQV